MTGQAGFDFLPSRNPGIFLSLTEKQKMDNHSSPVERLLDAAAAVTAVGTLLDMLPSLAALFTIFWTGIRIWETRTVQAWFGRKMDQETDREKGSE